MRRPWCPRAAHLPACSPLTAGEVQHPHQGGGGAQQQRQRRQAGGGFPGRARGQLSKQPTLWGPHSLHCLCALPAAATNARPPCCSSTLLGPPASRHPCWAPLHAQCHALLLAHTACSSQLCHLSVTPGISIPRGRHVKQGPRGQAGTAAEACSSSAAISESTAATRPAASRLPLPPPAPPPQTLRPPAPHPPQPPGPRRRPARRPAPPLPAPAAGLKPGR